MEKRELRLKLASYARSDARVGIWQLCNSLIPFVLLCAAMGWAYPRSLGLLLALAVPAGLFMIRIFILQHDCGHSSLLPSPRANDWVGNVLSLITLTPFYNWRYVHNLHHATSGDLDRRSQGDIWLMTVEEYQAASPWRKFKYRFYRHPLMLFFVGPPLYFLIRRRFPIHLAPSMKRARRNVYLTDLALFAVYAPIVAWLGIKMFAAIALPIVCIASTVGVWLFYVQHNYEDSYFERRENWNFFDAALHGSSFYNLPRWLRWFTADISVHHIHHFDSRIPNYKLRSCMEAEPDFQGAHSIDFIASLKLANLKLWDESLQQLVRFPT